MRPHEDDAPEEYRGEPTGGRYRAEPAGGGGEPRRGRGPPRGSRYQSAPPRGPPPEGPPPGSPPTRLERAREARGGPPPGGQAGSPPPGTQPSGTQPSGTQTQQAPPSEGQPPAQGRADQYGIQDPGAGTPGRPTAGQPDARGGQAGGQGSGGQPGRGPRGDVGGLAPVGVEELLQTEVVTAQPDTPVATVVAEMAERDVGSVVIVEDDAPVGVVTDRRIALALETTPDVAERQVEELLAEQFVTGSVGMSAVDVLRRLSEAGVRRLPIVDEDGGLAGIVTLDDVLVLLSEELANVADVVRTQSPRL